MIFARKNAALSAIKKMIEGAVGFAPQVDYDPFTFSQHENAKLKVIVKRILRKYGYPPDMQMLATETVLKQA